MVDVTVRSYGLISEDLGLGLFRDNEILVTSVALQKSRWGITGLFVIPLHKNNVRLGKNKYWTAKVPRENKSTTSQQAQIQKTEIQGV